MLRITEELLLLIMDAESGGIQHSLSAHQRDAVIAGSVLMDLALANRIDTDPERLFLIARDPVDDALLDPTLQELSAKPKRTTPPTGSCARRGAAMPSAERRSTG